MTRVSLLQLPAQDGRGLETSFDVVTEYVANAGETDLYLLPEMWTPGYFAFDDYSDAAGGFGSVTAFLSDLARTSGAYVHGGSVLQERGGDLFNCSVLFDRSGALVAEYRKIHLFGYGSREQELLTPGTEITVVDTEFGRVGLAVCYDLRFPEQFRAMTDDGAEIFLVASAWPFPRLGAWDTLLRARAIENQAYLLAANGTGQATSGALCGNSAVIDPWGVTIASAGDRETTVSADIDLGEVTNARTTFPALADRRVIAATSPTLVLERNGESPLNFAVRRVLLGGYTARDEAAVRRYIAKLEEEGIAPPDEVPTFFAVGAELVTTATAIDVAGAETCGEVEFVLFIADDGDIYVGAGSDHTDRGLEQVSIPAAKQACPKPVSQRVWRYSDVRPHWDDLIMRSFTPRDSHDAYQEAGVGTLIDPDGLIALVRSGFPGDLAGTVLFGGSVSSVGGGFTFSNSFRAEIHDPVTNDTLVAQYEIANVLEKGA